MSNNEKCNPSIKDVFITWFYDIIYHMNGWTGFKKIVFTASLLCILLALPSPYSFSVDEQPAKKDIKDDIEYKLDLAKSYLRQGFANPKESIYFDNAIKQYEDILKASPEHAEALADLADIYTLKGDTARAEELYKKLQKTDPAYATSRRSRIKQKTAEEPAKAELSLQKDTEYKLDLAKSYMRQGLANPQETVYFDNAIKRYEEILKADAGHREALADLADIHTLKGDNARAEELYKKLQKIDPAYAASRKMKISRKPSVEVPVKAAVDTAKEAEYKLDLANTYMRQGFANPKEDMYFDSAIKQYEDILKTSPGQKDALIGLAAIYSQKGNAAEAEALLKKMVAAEPNNMVYHLNLAFFYYSRDRKDEALEKVDWVISNSPRYGRAHLFKAAILEQKADLPSAIAEYRAAIISAEASRDIELATTGYFGLGRLYDKSNLFFDAVSQIEKIIKMRPNFPDGYLELARMCLRLGLTDKAISTLDSLANIKPDIPKAYMMLGLAYSRKGDFEKSLEYFKKAKASGIEVEDRIFSAIERKIKEADQKGKKDEKGK